MSSIILANSVLCLQVPDGSSRDKLEQDNEPNSGSTRLDRNDTSLKYFYESTANYWQCGKNSTLILAQSQEDSQESHNKTTLDTPLKTAISERSNSETVESHYETVSHQPQQLAPLLSQRIEKSIDSGIWSAARSLEADTAIAQADARFELEFAGVTS